MQDPRRRGPRDLRRLQVGQLSLLSPVPYHMHAFMRYRRIIGPEERSRETWRSSYGCRGDAMSQPAREAALRPAAAESYPFLPARMWTAAGRLAELVARYRGICATATDRAHRVLSDADFMFRGGEDARTGWAPAPST